MKKFLLTLFVFGVSFFLLEKAFYFFLWAAPKKEADKRLEMLITGKINKDIIILGSSRGARALLPLQLQDSIGWSAYNLSFPGSNVEFHEFVLRSLLKFNKKPKLVLLVVDDQNELLSTNLINFRYDRFYPLEKYNYINDEMKRRGEKNILSDFFVLARMNAKSFNIKKKKFAALDTIREAGAMPLTFEKEGRKWIYKTDSVHYNIQLEMQQKLEAFHNLQELCVAQNINLVLVCPPNYKKHSTEFENRMRQLSLPQVKLYVFDTLNPVYAARNSFSDESHLKINGATLFTNDLIHELKYGSLSQLLK